MPEYKTLGDLMIEDAMRRARWKAIRQLLYAVCAVTATVALVWMAAGK